MNKREKMYQQIKIHGEKLNTIFDTDLDPVTLCKRLRSIDLNAHRAAEDYCNGLTLTDDWTLKIISVSNKVDKLLRFRDKGIPIFINGDPRGYTLKIDDEYVREHNLDIYRDMGGYGILAPDFS